MTRLQRATAITVTILTAAALITAAPANAETVPAAVGQCYQMTDAQLDAIALPDIAPIDCTETHNAEIILTGAVPVGADPATYAQRQCTFDTVTSALGINKPRKGVVRNPLMVGAYNFTDGTIWQCATGFIRYLGVDENGDGIRTLQSMTGTMADAVRIPAAHRLCLKALFPWVSTPCNRTGIYLLTGVMASNQTGAFPGSDGIKAEATRRCPNTTTQYSGPGRDQWSRGHPNYIYCYRKF